MKKIISMALILLSFAFLSACGNKDKENTKEHNNDHNHEGHNHGTEEHNHENEMTGENSNIILFTDEQAKNILYFKIEEVKKQTFHQILKTSGQILSAPGDEVLISATMNGIVSVSIPKLVEGYSINANQQLFSISSKNLSENNISTRLSEAKAILESAKIEFDRATELANEKIISQKDFQQAKLTYEQARLNYQTYASGMSSNGKSITSPISGYLKNLTVQSGQYVEMGEALATVTQNKRLILKADVSQQYIPMIKNVKTATFVTPYDNKTYDIDELGGKLISIGRNSGENSYLTPVSFEFDNKGSIIEGSFVEIYLKSLPINDAFVLPISALIEEQGHFFVFIKLDHENEYLKQEVRIGQSDGINRQIIEGVTEGQKIVTSGAYALKLASLSGSMPEHTH